MIAGGSGFLGRRLRAKLEHLGHRVLTLSRKRSTDDNTITWSPDGFTGTLPAHLDGIDAVVNLAGEGIADRRWTRARRQQIRQSRALATRTLVNAIAACARPPAVFVSASGVGYYGAHDDDIVTEATPPGGDFLASVCVEWEREASGVDASTTRLAVVRSGLVLDGREGALARMLLPFKLGAGATLGTGRQCMSWIHIDDWTSMVTWLITDRAAEGAFNATAPEPVTNREFTRVLARVLHRPALFTAPAFVLQAGLGKLSSVLLTGQRAVPAHAEQRGFSFVHRTLEPALRSLHV